MIKFKYNDKETGWALKKVFVLKRILKIIF